MEDYRFIDENNPSGSELSWNWNQFFEYLSMEGLQESSAFRLELGDADPADERSPEYINYYIYAIEYGQNRFDKNCQ